jgi:hypothetical protein
MSVRRVMLTLASAARRTPINVSSPAHDAAVIPRPIVRHNVADLFVDEVTREHVQVSSR